MVFSLIELPLSSKPISVTDSPIYYTRPEPLLHKDHPDAESAEAPEVHLKEPEHEGDSHGSAVEFLRNLQRADRHAADLVLCSFIKDPINFLTAGSCSASWGSI